MNALSPIVSARGVVKRFGSLTALNGVTLDISPGEFFGLLGPNGAGKSTFMSLISGLRPVDEVLLTWTATASRRARQGTARSRIGAAAHRPLLGAERGGQPSHLWGAIRA